MFDPERLISKRSRDVDASGIRRVFELARTIANPVNFSIGQPDFDVPDPVKEKAIEAIRAGRNRYTVTQGIEPLRLRFQKEFQTLYGSGGLWNDYGTLVTSGVSGALLLAILACLEEGDEVLVPDPYFVMYKHVARLAGARCLFVDTYPDFRLTAQRIEKLVTSRTKILLVSSPCNPTGSVITSQEWADIAALAKERGFLIVSDEIYDAFCYEPVQTPLGPRAPSPAAFSDQILVLRGFSKTYGMTGWRLGIAAGPKPIIEQMAKLQQYTFVCAPSMAQEAGVTALDVDMSGHVADYRRKRDRVVERLRPHFDLVTPGGAFYAFPAVPGGRTGAQFSERAISKSLLIIPGGVFSERDTHFRISYACDDATLERGLDILLELADK